MQKRWNVLVVPNAPGSNIFSYDLSSRSLWIAAVAAVSFIILTTTIVLYSAHRWKSEKLAQVSRLESKLQTREGEFSRLKQEFSILEELEDKLRTIAGLKPRNHSDVDAQAGGQGGPGQEGDGGDMAPSAIMDGSRRPATHSTPRELLGDSIELKDSLEEVLDVFENERDRLACIPSINPVASQDAWISSGFGYRTDPISGKRRFHEGCDLVAPRKTPVIAPAGGVVTYAGWREGLGRTVQIEHGYGYKTIYGHNSKLVVKKGDRVERGDVIAHVGSSGRSTGPHLHYEIHRNDKVVNPYKYVVQ